MMNELITYLISVLAVVLLAAGWAAVQVIARRMGTKNHIDNASSCGNGCMCGGSEDSCQRKTTN